MQYKIKSCLLFHHLQSPEARTILSFVDNPDTVVGVDVVETLQDRINLVAKVNATEDGYQIVIHMVMTDEKTDCVSSHNKFTIRHKNGF